MCLLFSFPFIHNHWAELCSRDSKKAYVAVKRYGYRGKTTQLATVGHLFLQLVVFSHDFKHHLSLFDVVSKEEHSKLTTSKCRRYVTEDFDNCQQMAQMFKNKFPYIYI